MTTELQVPINLPPAPHVLANTSFLTTLAQVEEQVATLAITDAQSAQNAANLTARPTSAGNQLEKARKALKQPFIEAGRAIGAAAEEPSRRIDKAKAAVRSALAAYEAEQRRLADEAEKKRQAELRRLEEQRQKEEAEAAKRQAEIDEAARKAAAASKVEVLDIDDEPVPAPKTETQKQIDAIKFAPAPVVTKPVGVAFKTFLTFVVEDVRKLPDVFVERSAKMAAIRAAFCNGWKEGEPMPVCDGVRFEVKRDVASTGKGAF